MPNFTFKNHKKETGLAAINQLYSADIKYKKKICGLIVGRHNEYSVRFMIRKEPTKADPAPFRWITIKKKFESRKEAKEFLKPRTRAVISKYDLYFMDPY